MLVITQKSGLFYLQLRQPKCWVHILIIGEGSYDLLHLDSFQPNGEVKMTCNCYNYPASFMFETTQSQDKNILILVTLTKLPSVISKLKVCY